MAKCILCDAKATINQQDNASRTIYNCQNCGVFVLSDIVEQEVRNNRCKMSAYFTYRKLAGHNEVILVTYDKAKKDKDYLQLTVEQVLGHYPKSFTEIMDMVLLNLSRLSAYEGAEIKVENLDMHPVFFVKKASYDSLSFIIKSMQKLELLEVNYYSSSFFPCGIIVSPKGWDRVAELQGGGIVRDNVLMVHTGNDNDSGETFRVSASKAARECGYHVVESDAASNGGRINHELIAWMKASRFIITDLSSPSGAAYYSKGMAMALGKTNILTCHKDTYGKLEIDTEQFSVLAWKDEEELYLKVLNAIRSLI